MIDQTELNEVKQNYTKYVEYYQKVYELIQGMKEYKNSFSSMNVKLIDTKLDNVITAIDASLDLVNEDYLLYYASSQHKKVSDVLKTL